MDETGLDAGDEIDLIVPDSLECSTGSLKCILSTLSIVSA
jgi:hypothetical protein